MKLRHIFETGFYVFLSLIAITIEFMAIEELGVSQGLLWSVPGLFVLFALAAQIGKKNFPD